MKDTMLDKAERAAFGHADTDDMEQLAAALPPKDTPYDPLGGWTDMPEEDPAPAKVETPK